MPEAFQLTPQTHEGTMSEYSADTASAAPSNGIGSGAGGGIGVGTGRGVGPGSGAGYGGGTLQMGSVGKLAGSSIAGRVTDTAGAVISGATVTARNEGTGAIAIRRY